MNIKNLRQIVLDIETTGMNKSGIYHDGHRIIEIGAVEIIHRRVTGYNFHVYINPNRSIDLEAFNIHGISNEFLFDKPSFTSIVDDFINFIDGSELIIHNAQFDIGFINYELSMLNNIYKKVESFCTIVDTLQLARKMFPGRRNSLDALCERYSIDKSHRILHNAIIDAKLLANIYILMTSRQENIDLSTFPQCYQSCYNKDVLQDDKVYDNSNLQVIYASEEEIVEHNKILDLILKARGYCKWYDYD